MKVKSMAVAETGNLTNKRI